MKFFVGYQMFDGDSLTKELIAKGAYIRGIFFMGRYSKRQKQPPNVRRYDAI